MPIVPVTASADYKTVDGTSRQFDTTMVNGKFWVFESSVACLINQGTNPTAAAADANTLIGPFEPVMIDGRLGAKLAVIKAGADDGIATLTPADFPSA
jgi:hypothetical protein